MHVFILTSQFVEYTSVEGTFATVEEATAHAHATSHGDVYVIEEWDGATPIHTAKDGGGIYLGYIRDVRKAR